MSSSRDGWAEPKIGIAAHRIRRGKGGRLRSGRRSSPCGRLCQVHPGTLVLLSGPLDTLSSWSPTAQELTAAGFRVAAPATAANAPPYATGWVAQAALALLAARPDEPLAVVARGTAGPLVPAFARAQRAARRRVGCYVFVDASLPSVAGSTHLDLLRAADPVAADRLHEAMHDHRRARPASTPAGHGRSAEHDLWTERLPPVPDWPDAPCGYVRTGVDAGPTGPTAWWARSAAQRGWLVDDEPPGSLATVLTAVTARLLG